MIRKESKLDLTLIVSSRRLISTRQIVSLEKPQRDSMFTSHLKQISHIRAGPSTTLFSRPCVMPEGILAVHASYMGCLYCFFFCVAGETFPDASFLYSCFCSRCCKITPFSLPVLVISCRIVFQQLRFWS